MALLGVAFLAYEGHSPQIIEGLRISSLCVETLYPMKTADDYTAAHS